MRRTFENGFAVLAFTALLCGVTLCVLYLVGIVAGGTTGATLSALASGFAEWAVRIAALAALVGIVYTYLTGQHSLTPVSRSPRKDPSTDE